MAAKISLMVTFTNIYKENICFSIHNPSPIETTGGKIKIFSCRVIEGLESIARRGY
jgi:hypothetical protein